MTPAHTDLVVRSITMLEKLVAFDTVSRNSNLALIDYVRGVLSDHGVESHLVFNADRSKANLLATIGPNVAGGVVLSGHTDVVPIDDQHWQSDPFTVVERDGRLYGRGTADMKSFLAIVLAALDIMKHADLKVPIHLAFSYDEEVGCIGVPTLIRLLREQLPPPSAVIVGEPTEMKVISAHKSITAVRTTVTGHEAHSSQTHRGVSAVMVAAELIQFLKSLAADAARLSCDAMFEPDHTTISVNHITGGTAVNILAHHCTFQWDIRTLPGDDAKLYLEKFRSYCDTTVLPRLRAIAPDCAIESVARAETPALRVDRNSAAEQLARALTGDNALRAVSFAAEAGLFQREGLPTVICGPGSISQAHQPNEFITLEQIELGVRFIHDLVRQLSH